MLFAYLKCLISQSTLSPCMQCNTMMTFQVIHNQSKLLWLVEMTSAMDWLYVQSKQHLQHLMWLRPGMWLKKRNTSVLSFPGRTWAGSRVQALPSTRNGIQAPVGWVIFNLDEPLISYDVHTEVASALSVVPVCKVCKVYIWLSVTDLMANLQKTFGK